MSFPVTQRTERIAKAILGGGLLALLLSALVLGGMAAGHAHADGGPGLYDPECPLAKLAAHSAGSPPPRAVSAEVPLTAGPLPEGPLPFSPSSPAISPANPRAPPTL